MVNTNELSNGLIKESTVVQEYLFRKIENTE